MKKLLQWIIQWTWGFAQNLTGLIFFLIFSHSYNRSKHGHAVVTKWNNQYGSISLGMFIFVTNDKDSNLIKHEYGHSLQSIILGPLWVFVIGFPSLIWAACFDGWRAKHKKSYYWLYTESWANKLGGAFED